MITFQDFEELFKQNAGDAISKVINDWKSGEIYNTAVTADTYDRQKNNTIMTFIKQMFSVSGLKIQDFTASNNKIASNFFRRLNVQRNTYSLGNGLKFKDDATKAKFGEDFDNTMFWGGYYSLIHAVCFLYSIGGDTGYFKATEFAPLWDEETGVLRGGVRFWQIDADKPTFAVLYLKEGRQKFKKDKKGFEAVDADIVPYGVNVTSTEATGVEDVQPFVYSDLPIVPLWGSTLHQSTLIGLQSQIDSYDLIRSGFANDLTDVAQIYWILENYGGVDDKELERFLDRLKLNHIAEMDTSGGGKLTPYSQDIPFQARQAYLQHIRGEIYEGFGAFDTSAMSAAPKTATEIESAYQPLDENADDYEYQIISCVKSLAKIIGIDPAKATPEFKRNRVANASEMVDMLVSLADTLDTETIIDHIPFITVDEKDKVMQRIQEKELSRIEDEYDQTDLDEDISSDGDIVDQISNMDTEYLQEFADEIISMLEGLANEV